MNNLSNIGVAGLAVMGENLVLNMASKGFSVSVFNRTSAKVDIFLAGRAKGKSISGFHSVKDFVNSLERPRKVMMMLKAGSVVDGFIEQLLPFLEEGESLLTAGIPTITIPSAGWLLLPKKVVVYRNRRFRRGRGRSERAVHHAWRGFCCLEGAGTDPGAYFSKSG